MSRPREFVPSHICNDVSVGISSNQNDRVGDMGRTDL